LRRTEESSQIRNPHLAKLIRRWRKLKGVATIRFEDGTIHRVELHWYEAHGIGRWETKD
jgi:hypothetical protein